MHLNELSHFINLISWLGELLATNLTRRDIKTQRTWFSNERNRIKQERRKRIMIGVGWALHVDPDSKIPYWYNDDTGTHFCCTY